jgi:tetratricopeptide (TPR) repeat protein
MTDPEVETEAISSLALEAIATFEEARDALGLAKAWALVGDTQWHMCRAEDMEGAFLKALECLEATDRQNRPAWILRLLALCYYAGPAPVDLAIARCNDLLNRGQGNTATDVAIWASIGSLEALRGHFDLARELFDRSRATGEEFGMAPTLAALPVLTGPVEILAGDLTGAISQLSDGCAALRHLGHTNVLSTAAALLARALERSGDEKAADQWTTVSEHASSKDDMSSQMLWRGVRSRLLSAAGEHDQAVAVASEGVAIAERTDFLVRHGEALVDLAVALARSGRPSDAEFARDRAVVLFTAKGNTVLARQAEQLCFD